VAIPHGYGLIDKQLFIPEKWFTDEYSLHRKKCNLPEDSTFTSKPQLAVQMLNEFVEKNRFPSNGSLQIPYMGTALSS